MTMMLIMLKMMLTFGLRQKGDIYIMMKKEKQKTKNKNEHTEA